MNFPNFETAYRREGILLQEIRDLQVFLSARCKQDVNEVIPAERFQQRRIATLQAMNASMTELREVRTWMRDYRKESKTVRRRRFRAALEKITALEGNHEAKQIADEALKPLPNR